MRTLLRRSLLAQLLGGYLLFVTIVLMGGIGLTAIVRHQLEAGTQAADLALAKTIALETASRMESARESVAALAGSAVVRGGDERAMGQAFVTFKAARPDLDRVYWLDAAGVLRVSVPGDPRTLGADYADERVFRHAQTATVAFVEAGGVDPTTFNGVVVVAQPVRDADGQLLGLVATNMLLDGLSGPLRTVVDDQGRQGKTLLISTIDNHGNLIATPQRERLLQPMLDELPGAREALAGAQVARVGPGPRDQDWLYTAAPVPEVGWAVIVQRPASEALAVVGSVQAWLVGALALVALVGLGWWLALTRRVSVPLRALARRYATFPAADQPPGGPPALGRADEVGSLARALHRLERDVAAHVAELRTLLETSSAVVGALDPAAVAATITREAQRLVDVQAAAVLVPGEDGALRVLASEGRAAEYDDAIRIDPGDPSSPSALALRERRPIQMLADQDAAFPAFSRAAGFRSLLAVPIVSRHVGGVVLLVSRREARPFAVGEVDLLQTFAAHATLAWEHAVLYERSDERLREVARENERLYREALAANKFKGTLLAAVGHELRTPLAAIKGHASTLLAEDVAWSPEEQRHSLRLISDAADRMADLVSNLLDLSRLEAGLLPLHPAPWSLDDLLDGALARLPGPIPWLTRAIPPDLPPLAVDRQRLEVVFANLLANALAYGDGGVWVEAERRRGEVIVRVRDDGPGIAPEELPHIFERFYRARRGVQRRAGGTGLGLAICKAFVEAHGGAIWAEGAGRGTTISLSLRAAASQTGDDGPGAPRATELASPGGRR